MDHSDSLGTGLENAEKKMADLGMRSCWGFGSWGSKRSRDLSIERSLESSAGQLKTPQGYTEQKDDVDEQDARDIWNDCKDRRPP